MSIQEHQKTLYRGLLGLRVPNSSPPLPNLNPHLERGAGGRGEVPEKTRPTPKKIKLVDL